MATPSSSPAEAGAPALASDARPSKRRRKSTAVPEEKLPEEERLRRQRQRELQALAVQQRAKGREYNPHKCKAKVFKSENTDVKERPSQAKKHVKAKPEAEFQVVIIPIFWNQRAAEKKLVISRSEEAAELLTQQGITSHVDVNNRFTPGQRMRHWEEKGVKVRLEVGPKDAEQSQCVIARSQPVAGQVAYKVPGDVGPGLVAQVQALLGMADEDVPAGDVSKYNKAAEEATAKGRAESGSVDGDVEEAAGQAPGGPSRRRAPQGGDDLEDDFMEVLDDEEGSSDRKKGRKKGKR